MKRYLDTVILGLGLFFLGFGIYLVYERISPRHPVFANSSSQSSASTSPTRLTIPAGQIDLPILPATIINHKWELSRTGVSYLTTSPLPGHLGNSVMYGHNWGNLLGNLHAVKIGDPLVITLSDGQTLTYLVHFVSVVTPDETHIYDNTSDYRLTLYTCTGFLDSKRLVITALK